MVTSFALVSPRFARDTAVRAEAAPPAAEVASATAAPHDMCEADMRRWVEAWYAAHPTRGENAANAAAADTFFVGNNFFDTDGRIATVVDTARILVGQTILWSFVAGIHTTTSGTGGGDPQAGMLWDQPIDQGHQAFSFTFPQAGTFRFFCRPHEFFNMRGVVLVSVPSDVVPIDAPDGTLGFAAGPFPNPTRLGATFHFAIREPGQVRVEVFDATGRRLAMPFDGRLPAGRFAMGWDGSTLGGDRAPAGVYYLRLSVPGRTESRRLVVAH